MTKRYKYVLVDEYQDTNPTQFEMIHHLTSAHRNLVVVGDDDQSIYSWRGATPANILEFETIYKNAKRVMLEQNFRSTSNIINAASAMIAHNLHRAPKTLFTKNPAGELIDFDYEMDGELEAMWVVDAIQKERKRFGLDEVAVFYRTNSQSRAMEEALRREGIPYRIYGAVRFYDRMEVKDVIAYFRLMANPADDVSFKRVINTPPRQLGDKAVDAIEVEAARRGQPMLATAKQMGEEGYPRLGVKLAEFMKLMDRLKKEVLEAPLDEAVELVLNATEYHKYLSKRYPEQALDKIENVHELAAAMADFSTRQPEATLLDWLQQVALTRDEGDDVLTGVTMMTLHMAKGLEFPRVYIVGLEEGLLPHRSSLGDSDLIEEERRLFYVGMTRAKEQLSLGAAYRRRMFDKVVANQPSRFIKEIPKEFFKELKIFEEGPKVIPSDRSSGTYYDYEDRGGDRDPEEFEVGEAVFHPTYGRGLIVDLEREYGTWKAVVEFSSFGRRKVMCHHLS